VIPRPDHLRRLQGLLDRHPVVALLGARQVGKTTLARRLHDAWEGEKAFLDLEHPTDLARLEDPLLGLQDLRGLVVLDEVQRRPDLFPVLRVLADRRETPARFLVLGSASPDLLRQSSESLAGRIAYHELNGLALDEVGVAALETLWNRGGFPRSFLADGDAHSAEWRRAFIRTFLERDLPQLGIQIPAETLRRFWTMLAHWHGQVWNGAELGRAFGVSASTVRRYLDLLTSALVLRQLPPWLENLGKRQVRSPKVYVQDSGLLHSLLGLEDLDALRGHPKVGASWEGFALEAVVRHLGARPEETFFWATHGGAELDLLVVRGTRRLGFEFKHSSAPRARRSMHVALEDLGLEHLWVVYPGGERFRLAERIEAVPLARILDDLEPLDGLDSAR
jgi:hypothetical protein